MGSLRGRLSSLSLQPRGRSDKMFQYVGSASSLSSRQLLAPRKTCLCRTYAHLVGSFFRRYGRPYTCRQTSLGAGCIALHHARYLCKFLSWRCRLRRRPCYLASSFPMTPNITVKAVAAFSLHWTSRNWAAPYLQRYVPLYCKLAGTP